MEKKLRETYINKRYIDSKVAHNEPSLTPKVALNKQLKSKKNQGFSASSKNNSLTMRRKFDIFLSK